LQCYISGKS